MLQNGRGFDLKNKNKSKRGLEAETRYIESQIAISLIVTRSID